MPKITIIGGGSFLWAFGFVRQFVTAERLGDTRVTLMDIDPDALDLLGRATGRFNDAHGAPIALETTGDLDAALDGADYVLACISTGGLDAMRHDLEIPERYGIYHPVGDTVGPGGWLRAVRNIPVFYDFGARMQARCPRAWFINMSNPLTPLTRVPHKFFGLKCLGMCPGVEETARQYATLAGLPADAPLDYVVTGIDHGSWFTALRAGEVDLIARLRALGYCASDDAFLGGLPAAQWPAEARGLRAAFAVWRETGYLPSLGDRHVTENWPWFLNGGPELPYGIVRTFITDRHEGKQARRAALAHYADTGDDAALGTLGHGDDPIVYVIEALEGQREFLWGANYANIGQTPGLPADAVVETRCRFDGAGVHPLASPMPALLQSLVLPQVLRQELIVDIALNGTFDELAALMTSDPLCARLPMGQARAMTREMLTATRAWIRNPRLC